MSIEKSIRTQNGSHPQISKWNIVSFPVVDSYVWLRFEQIIEERDPNFNWAELQNFTRKRPNPISIKISLTFSDIWNTVFYIPPPQDWDGYQTKQSPKTVSKFHGRSHAVVGGSLVQCFRNQSHWILVNSCYTIKNFVSRRSIPTV